MQFLPYAYAAAGGLGGNLAETQFDNLFERIDIEGRDVTPDNYPPGTTGAAPLS